MKQPNNETGNQSESERNTASTVGLFKCIVSDLFFYNNQKSATSVFVIPTSVEKFVKRRDPRPFKRGEERLVHGLLRCTTCGCVWNRDVHGASNILFAAKSVLSGEGRPRYLSRSSSGAFYDAPNQNDPSCYADV